MKSTEDLVVPDPRRLVPRSPAIRSTRAVRSIKRVEILLNLPPNQAGSVRCLPPIGIYPRRTEAGRLPSQPEAGRARRGVAMAAPVRRFLQPFSPGRV